MSNLTRTECVAALYREGGFGVNTWAGHVIFTQKLSLSLSLVGL